MTKRQNKLGTYLAVTAGVGCASSVANAAVTFYGVNSANDTNMNPAGINFGLGRIDQAFNSASVIRYNTVPSTTYFTSGSDLGGSGAQSAGTYVDNTVTFFGGAQAGDQNYANISFDGFVSGATTYEAVAQFYFDGTGGGYLIAIATVNAVSDPKNLSGVGGATLEISAGKAMIDAAAVPEPSSVALLALGATGLITRRHRKAA